MGRGISLKSPASSAKSSGNQELNAVRLWLDSSRRITIQSYGHRESHADPLFTENTSRENQPGHVCRIKSTWALLIAAEGIVGQIRMSAVLRIKSVENLCQNCLNIRHNSRRLDFATKAHFASQGSKSSALVHRCADLGIEIPHWRPWNSEGCYRPIQISQIWKLRWMLLNTMWVPGLIKTCLFSHHRPNKKTFRSAWHQRGRRISQTGMNQQDVKECVAS